MYCTVPGSFAVGDHLRYCTVLSTCNNYIFYCICDFHKRLLKDLWFKFVFIWICYCVPSFAATVGKCIDYSQITVNYCFVITKYHTQEKKQQKANSFFWSGYYFIASRSRQRHLKLLKLFLVLAAFSLADLQYIKSHCLTERTALTNSHYVTKTNIPKHK